MRAALFEKAGRPLEIVDLPIPSPGAGEVLIKVHRCGICGTDLHMTEAHSAGHTNPSVSAMRKRFEGKVLGHEYAGEIIELGKDVSGLKVGDRISGMPIGGCGICAQCQGGYPVWCNERQSYHGGFGQFTKIQAAFAVPLPASLSFADGALIEPLAVGLHAVELAGRIDGARVLVVGAGGVGLAVISWARRLGALRIVAQALSTQEHERACALGADALIEAGEGAASRIEAVLGGLPDIVFECVGLPGLMRQAIERVRPGGTVIVAGVCLADDTFSPISALGKELTLRFSNAYTLSDLQRSADALAADPSAPNAMISETVSLDETPQMFEVLRRRTTGSKVLVDPWA